MLTLSLLTLLLLVNQNNLVISLLWLILLFSLSNSGVSIWYEFNSFSSTIISLSILVSALILIVSNGAQSRVVISLLLILVTFFITNNLILLYIFFELSLIPTLFLVLNWGYQPERLQAGYYLIIYTITASLPLLWIITRFYSEAYSLSLTTSFLFFTPSYFNSYLSSGAFLIAFLVNLPTFGAHLWLPNAHVEAPVSGSIILAGLLLNLGGYGLINITYILNNCDNNFSLLIISSSLWGACIISFVCVNSLDINKLIAYSSVVHINLLILGILSNSNLGNNGAILIIISHGISSPGIFALANFNYTNTNSRNILFHNNLSPLQSPLSIAWFLVISANIAAPPSLNLASEILIVISILNITFLSATLLALVTFISAGYNLYLFSSQQGNNIIPPHQNNNSNDFLASLIQSSLCFFLILILPLWI